ncbi:MAG: HPF/RaiA family ribosome-associated protein, partial [Planctomycetes bacterium]|nr:HPF/RaiA family ribosome-associated protein [Planctomycetota bacterium]
LRGYAERKVADIEHFGQDFEKSEVVLDIERHETICEIVLHPRRGPAYVATERAPDGRSAVDGAAAKIERQVLKDKQRSEAKRRQGAD